jgi:hypothetical protein
MVPLTRQGMLRIFVELVLLCKASQLPSKFPLEAKVQVAFQQFDCKKTAKEGPFPFIQDVVDGPLSSQNALQVELKCKGNDSHLHRGKHVILSTCLVDVTGYTTYHDGGGSFLGLGLGLGFEEDFMPLLHDHGV